MRKCRQCGNQLTNYRQMDCPPEGNEEWSKCQQKSRAVVNKRYKQSPGFRPENFKVYVNPKYDVSCLKCDKIFKGNKGIRICPECTTFLTHYQKFGNPRTGIITGFRITPHSFSGHEEVSTYQYEHGKAI